jgi:hypothetical protein
MSTLDCNNEKNGSQILATTLFETGSRHVIRLRRKPTARKKWG